MNTRTTGIMAALLGVCAAAVAAVVPLEQMLSAPGWGELKGEHFIVYYEEQSGGPTAKTVLQKAEEYYRRIGEQIGYTRYSDFWTWDERVKIVIFPDQASYSQATGQPAWSTGYANRDTRLFESRSIVSFEQQAEFYDSILPHEVSHLILHDFIGENIPVWFDEGVAQLQEAAKSEIADRMMSILVERKQTVPLATLTRWDIRGEEDPVKVKLFYAESLSVIEFLIERYGSQDFGRLCRQMRDGKGFEEALRNVYPTRLKSLTELETQWLKRMRQK